MTRQDREEKLLPKRADWEQQLLAHRRWLHQHPELAFLEEETTKYIVKHLKRANIPCRQLGKSGVIADLAVDKALPTIAVRAEIDAIAVPEETGLPFASLYEGNMHACGHDANTAILLTLAEVLAEKKEYLSCNVRFLFEPAEEIGEGADYMIQHGALENPKPESVVIFHFGNQEPRAMEIQQSITTAKIGGLEIHITGRSAHFFQYEEGIDAMYAASRLLIAVEEINRLVSTEHPFVLAFGCMSAGTGGNIVAETADLKGSLRAFTEEDFQAVYLELQKRAEEIERETGAKIQIVMTKVIPPIINEKQMVARGSEVGRYIFGDQFQIGTKPFLVGDNAAYYMEEVPGMRVVFLAKKEQEAVYPMHNPRFDLDESVMMDALRFLLLFLFERQ
ncbi:MAG: M20 metallopeptidase family protein [Lachnospiraceae bacterium]